MSGQLPSEATQAINQWALAMKKILQDRTKELGKLLVQDGFSAEDVTSLVPEPATPATPKGA